MRQLLFHQTSFDTADLRDGSEFFAEAKGDDNLVLKAAEANLVRTIMSHPVLRNSLVGALQRSTQVWWHAGVTDPFITDRYKQPGDIDLLLCEKPRPDESVVMEFKRVKVTITGEHQAQVNRLADVGKGVRQANALRELGFFQTYLCILTVVGAVRQTAHNPLCRGVTAETTHDFGDTKTFSKIVEFPDREDLHPDVGIVFLELVQPTGKDYRDHGTIRVCVDQKASPQRQSGELTNKINQYSSKTP